MTKMWRSLWPLFSVLILFTVVTAFGISIALWNYFGDQDVRRLEIIEANERGDVERDDDRSPRQELIDAVFEDRLVFEGEHTFAFTDGVQYRLLLFNSWLQERPGLNPYRIVVTNNDYDLLTSYDSGGYISSSSIVFNSGKTGLRVNYSGPHIQMFGTDCYDISPDKITPIECD